VPIFIERGAAVAWPVAARAAAGNASFHDWRRSVKQGLVASYNRPGGNATELSHRTATRDAAQRNATWDDGVDPYTVVL